MSQPAKQLKKPKFIKIGNLEPGGKGVNAYVKVVSVKVVLDRQKIDDTKEVIAEAVVGDSTGSILLTAKDEQLAVVKQNANLVIRNARVVMFKGHMRLKVDQWGLIDPNPEPFNEQVNQANNLSDTEYELVEDE